jgi:hypothetical protein
LISGKTQPNGLNCSEQVSHTADALIFLDLTEFFLVPLFLQFLSFFDLFDFTIWATPVFVVSLCQRPL